MKLIHSSRLLIALAILIISNTSQAKENSFKWRKTYSDSKYAAFFYLADIKFDSSGNKFILGSEIQGTDDYNMVLVGCNSIGDTILHCTYKDPKLPLTRDFSNKLYFDANGNIIVIGSSQGDLYYSSTVVLKYDRTGTLLWEYKYYNTEGFEHYVRNPIWMTPTTCNY